MGAAMIAVTIEMTARSEPIEGRVAVPGRDPRPFVGWLELISLLEAASKEVAEP